MLQKLPHLMILHKIKVKRKLLLNYQRRVKNKKYQSLMIVRKTKQPMVLKDQHRIKMMEFHSGILIINSMSVTLLLECHHNRFQSCLILAHLLCMPYLLNVRKDARNHLCNLMLIIQELSKTLQIRDKTSTTVTVLYQVVWVRTKYALARIPIIVAHFNFQKQIKDMNYKKINSVELLAQLLHLAKKKQ